MYKLIRFSPNPDVLKKQQGFSLLEMVVGISIMGTLMLIAFGTFMLSAQTASRLMTETDLRWEVRKTMELMRNDIQRSSMAHYMEESNGKLSSTRLRFTDLSGTFIQYQRLNTQVLRRKNGGNDWSTLLTGVAANSFAYFDADLNSVDERDDTSFIEVTLTVTNNNMTVTLRDRFYVRN